MIRVALKGLAGRKLRSVLTAVAIVLGVAMVSGTFVLTDTIEKGFDTIFEQSYENTDAVITGKTAFATEEDESEAPSFSEDLLPRVAELPGVAAIEGGIEDEAQLINEDGDTIARGDAPGLAFSVDPEGGDRFNPLTLVDGRWPTGAGQIAVDRGTAADSNLALGDRIRVAAGGPAQSFEVVGIAEFGELESIGGATLAIFDLRTAQRLFDKVGRLDSISVAAEPGVSPAELVSRIEPLLPPTAQVRSGEAQAAEDASETSSFISIFRNILLAFGGIALFVGSFVIANTLTITIAQRVREFATLRTIGASRRQVLGSVLLEATVIGALASVVGLFLGLALAKGLNALIVSLGIALPQSGTVFATRTIVVSLLVGTLVTLAASLRPAFRATRVPPIAAVREGSILPPSRFARFSSMTALGVLGLGIAALAYGVFAGGLATATRLLSLAGGTLLLFIGVALVAPRLIRPLASALGWPGARIGGVSGELARENAKRNPQRTASTAAALMIGISLVTFVAILGQGIRAPFEDAVDELFVADYALTGEQAFDSTSPEAEEAVRRSPAAEVVSAVRGGEGRAFGTDIFVTGVDRNVAQVLEFDWVEGSNSVREGLGPDGALVKSDYAEDRKLAIGSSVDVLTPAGETLELQVRGIFDEPAGGSPFGEITISTDAFDDAYPQPENLMTFINVRGSPDAAAITSLEAAIGPFPEVKVVTASQFKEDATAPLDNLLNLLYALLGLSVIVSVFGIVNTLVLTVFERTRELGMLRAVGMTRRQVRRMIRHESIVTSLIGAVLGIAVGLFLALLVTRALADEGIVFAVPAGSLAMFVVAAIVVGLLAAILPARRASRLNVLRALQYE